jgi:hypothetical protein
MGLVVTACCLWETLCNFRATGRMNVSKTPCSQLEGRILWSGEDRVFQWFKGLSIWDDCAEREPEEEVEKWWDEMEMALPDVSLRLRKDEDIGRV